MRSSGVKWNVSAVSAPDSVHSNRSTSDPIAGETNFAVAWTCAHGRGMVFSGLDSFLEHVWVGFRGRVSRSATTKEG